MRIYNKGDRTLVPQMVSISNMERLIKELGHIEELDACPWCGSDSADHPLWCKDEGLLKTAQCSQCGIVYVRSRLNKKGRAAYYMSYYSEIHQSDNEMNDKREAMYAIERKFIERHISGGRILDVGCSGGNFLRHFDHDRWDCWGIEYGVEAAQAARKKIGPQIICGELPEADLPVGTFDLVVFRGVIEHVPDPKRYLEAAVKLLAPEGRIFIGSTPNRDSLCADLFRDKWNQHFPALHIFHFSLNDFKQFFHQRSMRLIDESLFYLNTPYAEIERDIALVKKAIEYRSSGREIDFKSPPFWGNMMTSIFKKGRN